MYLPETTQNISAIGLGLSIYTKLSQDCMKFLPKWHRKGCLIKLLDRYRPEENSGRCARANLSVRKAAEMYGVPTDIPVEALVISRACPVCASSN